MINADIYVQTYLFDHHVSEAGASEVECVWVCAHKICSSDFRIRWHAFFLFAKRLITFQPLLRTSQLAMDIADLRPQIENLSGTISDLETALKPLTDANLSTSAAKLPLLEQAKLYVLATYALESTLFSSLRLAGVDAKAHPVFAELARVKQYFAKIKSAEAAGPGKRTSTLDRDAAQRFIKHGLAGNEKHDAARVERIEWERAGAKRKLEEMPTGTYTRFDGPAKRIRAVEDGGVDSSSASEAHVKSKSRRDRKAEKRARELQEESLSSPASVGDVGDEGHVVNADDGLQESGNATRSVAANSPNEASHSESLQEGLARKAAKREKKEKERAERRERKKKRREGGGEQVMFINDDQN